MKKEFTNLTATVTNEAGEIINSDENTFVSLIADTGKLIQQKSTGITGTRVDIGGGDSEDNYEEIDDLMYQKVIDDIVSEVGEND